MKQFDMGKIDIAWCPGCGNFAIINILKKALDELNMNPEDIVLVSGIGQAAKTPQYIKSNYFNGLHGRSLGPATAIKASNPALNVIVTSGDGDMYGEGGNHFIHTIRRNPNITVIVHDNMVYGLTKGQASPTSPKGMKTPVQTTGVVLEPFNPIAVAVSLDASFVARASVNNMEQAKDLIKKAILHKGFALVDIFQPCVTFNKINTYDWYKEHTYDLDANYDPHNKVQAFSKALETEKMPLGVIYMHEKPSFEELVGIYETDSTPLFRRKLDKEKLVALINGKKKMTAVAPKVSKHDSRIVYIHQETPDVKTLVLERPVGFNYLAGQYAMIGFSDNRKIGNKTSIPITIASSPTEDKLRFTIKDTGEFTKELYKTNVGDFLSVNGPGGESYNFDSTCKDNIVMISGGTGITPFISTLRFMRDKGMKNRIIMINGNRNYDEIIYRLELDSLSHDNVFIMNTLDSYSDDWRGEKGYINMEMIFRYVPKDRLNEFTWMLCGPPIMVNGLEKSLKEAGVKNIKRDRWELPSSSDKKP